MRPPQNIYATCNPEEVSSLLSHRSYPLNTMEDLDPLISFIGDAKYVLLGGASHGTHEYYSWRMKITKRLIEEKNFSFIAAEGDWPDCYRLNRYVKRYPYSGKNAFSVLQEFDRWPTWIWANWEMVAFADWLRRHNKKMLRAKRVGFYGLDIFSFWESMQAIVKYLEKNDTEALKTAKKILNCFAPFAKDEGFSYERAARMVPKTCEKEVLNLLKEIKSKISHYNSDRENVFSTEQNALIAVNAEKYYRKMMDGGCESWNIRDQHMSDTLDRLLKFHGENSKVIVWEHNAHIGDGRTTGMASEGMLNLGQMIMEKHANEGVVSVGFGSYKGSVIAGRKWGEPMRKENVPNAQEGSWENMFHFAAEGKNKLLMMNRLENEECVASHIPHRSIGVLYDPANDKTDNYISTILPLRYDAFIFLDKTSALHPLHIFPNGNLTPDTFPFGL